MSDHEEAASEEGYVTPIPALYDHRHQIAASQRSPRPRRGTFDSLYGARNMQQEEALNNPDTADIVVRDFEEAVVDDEAGEFSPGPTARRPTFGTVADQRSLSPPNSVKAFAEARRREREYSFSEPKSDRKPDDDGLSRAMSINSRRSRRSRPTTIDQDGRSIMSNKTAEDDVCFPVNEGHRKDQLYIDFDYLEDLIIADSTREATTISKKEPEPKVFTDLRTPTGDARTQAVTSDGDIIEMPSDDSITHEKVASEIPTEPVPKPQQYQPDANRFSFFSSAWESTIHATELGDLVLPGEDIRTLFNFPKDDVDGVWWLNVNSPTREEVQAICKAFGIHPLTLEDIATRESREKIELFPSYYFSSFRSFKTVQDTDGVEYEPHNIYVVVFREGTLSFSFEPNPHATHVLKRIALLQDFVALSSDWICYAMIDDIVDCFAPVIHQIEIEADAIEDAVFVAREDESNSFLRSIGRVRKNSLALMRLLGGKADVLKGFTKRCNENYKVTPRMDIGLYLGDIQDHVVTMVTNLGHFEKILSRAHSNYLAQLSINNISQGTDTNRVLSKITFLASILVPMNLVCGLFGMNVAVPFHDSDSLVPFFVIIGSLVILCAMLLVWARKQKYI